MSKLIPKKVELNLNEYLWVPDDGTVYELAKIVQDHISHPGDKESYVKVELMGKRLIEKEFPKSWTYLVDKTHLQDLNDLIEMNSLHEAPLLDVLRKRWSKDSMYTYTGDFLVSINPYHNITGQNDNPLRYLDMTTKYDSKKLLDPHVFAVANSSLRKLTLPASTVSEFKPSQSIIVTGESGAGKTEASKQVMNFLTIANKELFPGAGQVADKIKNVILDSNAIFEAFGNAKTVRNDNSSRFGKYIKLQYTSENQLYAAHTETFLLEKSRLVSVGKDDRNYHIFYQMIRGLDAATKTTLHLPDCESFKILSNGGSTVITTAQDDITEFKAVVKGLKEMDCVDKDIASLWELLACVLHLGNINVSTGVAGEGTPVALESKTMPLDQMTSIFGIASPAFIKALSIQTVEVKMRAEKYEKILSVEETKNNIGALIKWLYGAVFNWLVSKVNTAHRSLADVSNKTVVKFIGILDIFGFEILLNNTFEQLCINYANERLQQQFNELAFEVEQQEYAKEGLDWKSIRYRDNQTVIDLIGKKPSGLLIILEEHILMNRGPDDAALLNNFHTFHAGKHANYSKNKFGNEGFVVKHFAGEVSYSISGFITKNNDSLQDDLFELLSASQNPFVLDILNAQAAVASEGRDQRMESSARPKSMAVTSGLDTNGRPKSVALGGSTGTKMAATVSVSFRFRNQLDTLINTLRSTNAFYIKCIKPNGDKKAGDFNSQLVITQLRYSGVLEIVRIRREGYPTRTSYLDFYIENKELARGRNWTDPEKCTPEQLKQYCKQLCDEYAPKDSFQFGHNYLFLHHYVPQVMSSAIHAKRMQWATMIQARFRAFRAQKEYKRQLYEISAKMKADKATKIQALLRGRQVRKRNELEKKMNSIILLQSLARMAPKKKAFDKYLREKKASIILQTNARRVLARELFKKKVAATYLLQRNAKGFLARFKFNNQRAAAIKLQKVSRGKLNRDLFLAKVRCSKSIQGIARRFLLEKRNKSFIVQFHQLCQSAASVPNSSDAIKELLTKFAYIYRNKWNNFATAYQSAISCGQMKLLTDLGLSVHEVMEIDVYGRRLLHYAAQQPDLAVVKHLSDVMNTIRKVITVSIKEDDDDDGDEPASSPTQGQGGVTSGTDLVTGLPIIKGGWLKKQSTILGFKSLKRRWCVLTEESFILYKEFNKKPAGYIPIDTCIVERLPGKEPLIVIKRPEKNIPKRGFFSSDTKHDVFTLQTDSEAIAQEWLKQLKLVAGVLPFRDGPIKHVNSRIRGDWIRFPDRNNQTALHAVATLSAEKQAQYGDEAVRVAAWLVANGCSIDQKDSTGKSALQLAIANSNTTMIAFLAQRKATVDSLNEEEKSALQVSMGVLGRQLSVETKRGLLGEETQHLGAPVMSKGFSYLQIHFENFYYVETANSNFDVLDNPRLQVSVCNPSNAPIEAVQTLEAPGIVKKDAIWWGTTWFMQTPLENIGEDFAVVVRLMHGPPGSPMGTSGQVPLSRYRIVKEDIDTGRVTLKFVTSTAGNFSPRPEAPGSNGNRLTFNAKKPLGSPEIFSSYLEGEIEIVKSFREYDLMPLGRGINTEKKPFQFTPGVLNEPWTKDALKPVSKSSGKPNLLNSALKPLPRLRKFPAYSGTSVSRNPTPGRPRVYPPGESPSISPRPAAARSPMRRLVPKESAASTRATSMDDFTMPTVGGSGAPPRPKSLRVTPSSTPSTPATATASPSAVATSTATIDSPSPLPPKPERPPSLRTSPNLTIDTSIPGVKSAGIAVSVASPMNAQAGDDASRPLSVGPPKPDKPVKPPSVRKMDLHSSASGSN